jgi:hypothetical protein
MIINSIGVDESERKLSLDKIPSGDATWSDARLIACATSDRPVTANEACEPLGSRAPHRAVN